MKKFISLLSLLLLPLLFPTQSFAQFTWTSGVCHDSENPAVYNDVATIRGVECIVARILNLAIYFIGIVVFIMLIFGAYKLLFSGGDPKAVEASRNTITFAVLGLVLAIASWFMLDFIARFTGIDALRTFSVILQN